MFMLWFRLVVHCLIITLSNHRARTHALPAAALNTLNMFRRAALYRAVLYSVHCTPDCTVVTPRGNRRRVRGSSDTTGTTDQCMYTRGRFVSAEMRRYWHQHWAAPGHWSFHFTPRTHWFLCPVDQRPVAASWDSGHDCHRYPRYLLYCWNLRYQLNTIRTSISNERTLNQLCEY